MQSWEFFSQADDVRILNVATIFAQVNSNLLGPARNGIPCHRNEVWIGRST